MSPQKRKIQRRMQIESIDKKGYFKRPLGKKRFTTKRILNGNIKLISSRTILIDLLKLMKAKLKSKVLLRESAKSHKSKIEESERKIIKEIKKSGEKSIKQRKELGIEGGTATDLKTAIDKYMEFREIQGQKLNKIQRKEQERIGLLEEKLKETKKSRRISSGKGRLDSVILNMAGIPVRFEVNERNIALIEEKLRPQTVLEPRAVAIRRIVISNPKKRIIKIIKELKAKGIEVEYNFVAKEIRKMIDEKLIKRDYPQLNNNVTKGK